MWPAQGVCIISLGWVESLVTGEKGGFRIGMKAMEREVFGREGGKRKDSFRDTAPAASFRTA